MGSSNRRDNRVSTKEGEKRENGGELKRRSEGVGGRGQEGWVRGGRGRKGLKGKAVDGK